MMHARIVVGCRGGRVHRRGASIALVSVMLLALMAFVSLAIDIGRVRLAREQLQTAADASARAAARALPVSSEYALEQAVTVALLNHIIDAEKLDSAHLRQRSNPGVELETADDVHFGIWDNSSRTFTELSDSGSGQDDRRRANAISVSAKRIAARGTQLPLIFAPVVGVFSSDIERDASAYITSGPAKFGFVGINSITSNSNHVTIDSMLNGPAAIYGGVASDGNIDLSNSDVYGDARPGIGATLSMGGNSTVSGWTANLDYTLASRYPNASTPGSAQPIVLPAADADWALPPTGTPPSNSPDAPVQLKLPAATSLPKVNSLTVTGYVVLYVDGNVDLNGTAIDTAGSVPAKLQIVVTSANSAVDIGGGSMQYAHIYAPQSDVRVHGSPGFYGWIIGKSLGFLGSSALHYDETRDDHVPFNIALIR